MRTSEEIENAIGIFCEKERTNNVEAILDVLENDYDDIEIEDLYFDEDDIWTEQSAMRAREFLDGDIEFEELDKVE